MVRMLGKGLVGAVVLVGLLVFGRGWGPQGKVQEGDPGGLGTGRSLLPSPNWRRGSPPSGAEGPRPRPGPRTPLEVFAVVGAFHGDVKRILGIEEEPPLVMPVGRPAG